MGLFHDDNYNQNIPIVLFLTYQLQNIAFIIAFKIEWLSGHKQKPLKDHSLKLFKRRFAATKAIMN